MSRRTALLALACFGLFGVVAPRAVGAQTVRRLSQKDVPVLVNELRVRLNVPDTASAQAPAPRRLSDQEFRALADAAVQALRDLNDPADLASQESCAAQWGSHDAAGAELKKAAQNRRANLAVLQDQAAALLPLLEKYEQSTK